LGLLVTYLEEGELGKHYIIAPLEIATDGKEQALGLVQGPRRTRSRWRGCGKAWWNAACGRIGSACS